MRAPPPGSATAPASPDADPHALAAGAFVVVDRDGRCTQASAPAAALLGRDAEALTGAPLADALGDGSTLPDAIATAQATQEPAVVAAHGVRGAAGLLCRVLPGIDGALLLFEPAAPETPRRTRYLHAVLETVPECIKVVATDGTIVEMNAAGLEMLEATDASMVLGRPAVAFAAESSRAAFLAHHAEAFAGEPSTVELEIVTVAGRRRRVHMRSTPLRDAAGAVVGAVSVTHDVTERESDAERLRESEARFRALAASAPVGIFVGDADGRQTYANARYAAIWRMTPDESAGLGWTRRIHPDDRDALFGPGDAVRAEAPEFTHEHRIVLDDGEVRWVRRHVVERRDESGVPNGYIGTVEDVTERRAAAEAEAEARAAADRQRGRLEAVLEAMPAGVIFAEADGRITRATRQARLLWGGNVTAEGVEDYARYRARLRGSDRVLPMDDRLLTRALRGEASAPREMEIDRLDGGTSTVLTAASPVRDAAGNIIGGVVALIDISERVRLELQLRQAQKMEAVGQLAGGIAHDFNNLLTVINGNLEFARGDLPPEHPVQQDLAEVARAAERARTLVRQLLAFSRKQVVKPRDVDLNEVVRNADSLLRRVLGDEIAFATTLAPTPVVVRADRGQLEQVLMNLAVNARDAMLTAAHGHAGKGGALTIGTDRVELSAESAAGWAPLGPGRYVRLTVSDTGHGMDATTRAHIFEPFFTTKAVGRGTGLGLAMVYGIVTQAGGALRVESAPGAGATFSILLPTADHAAEAPAARGPEPLSRGRGTVLIVEDESAVRVTTRRVLERQGYAVLEARHGADALLVWREHRRHVVACVTDLRMPEMGGRELAALLRADAPALPVVYVSGYGEDAVAVGGPRDAFVGKPYTAEALVAALQSVTGDAAGDRR